jgi:hypothetical protein
VTRYTPSTDSFVTFYAAGQLATERHPVFSYDDVFAYEAEEVLTQRRVHYLPFLKPPVYLLFCAPLALLSFLPSLFYSWRQHWRSV